MADDLSRMLPFLTDDEIAAVCAPLQQPAAQVRYLQSLGLRVIRKPNGRALVARSEFDRVMTGRERLAANDPAPTVQPDAAALAALFTRRGKHGTQAQGR